MNTKEILTLSKLIENENQRLERELIEGIREKELQLTGKEKIFLFIIWLATILIINITILTIVDYFR